MTNYYKKYDWWTGYKSIGEIQYKIFLDNNKIVVMFQGTNEESDKKTNLDFPAEMYSDKKTYIHRGFKKAYLTIRNTLLNDLDEAITLYRVKDVLILGWSYGGTLATLLHNDLTTLRPAYVLDTWIYGSPKFMFLPSQEIKDKFKDIHRVEYWGDPIPLLVPFYSAIGTLERVGKFRIIPDIKYHMMYGESEV